jgi:valyl-tRNA synthetase
MIEQNRGAVERLGNVEKITFVENSLSNRPGARGTARFDVHVIYERKIDVAAESDRLKEGTGENRKRVGQQSEATRQRTVSRQGPGKSCRRPAPPRPGASRPAGKSAESS